jgi:hypothetical protein
MNREMNKEMIMNNVTDMTEARKLEDMAMRLTGNHEEARAIRKSIEADRAAPDPTREELIAELIADTFDEEVLMTREEAEWFIDNTLTEDA